MTLERQGEMSREDMNELLDDGMRTAAHFLQLRGEFFPFAVIKTSTGEVRHVQALLDDPRPDSDQVIASITSSLRQTARSGQCVSAAIITNTRLTDRIAGTTSDAIRAEIDDIDAEPVVCYVPYELNSGELKLGEVKASVGSRTIFLSSR
jgi:hypothetical protein